jgi:hypothetical protein
LVLLGFLLNAKQKYIPALIVWIVGDIGWIIYDIFIDNFSHGFLSFSLILINLYAIKNTYGRKDG